MNKGIAKIIEKAKKDKDILAVSIFGSFARGEKNRDIDVCLILKQGVKNSLLMSKKKLEYLSEFSDKFDIKVFQQLPLYIRHRVLKEGKLVFCVNDDQLYDLAYINAKEYEDFKPLYKSYLEGVKHA